MTPYVPPLSFPNYVPLVCDYYDAFDHKPDSSLQYVRLKYKIENSIIFVCKFIEHRLSNMFTHFS